MKKIMLQLSGWQRLWFFFSILLLLPFLFFLTMHVIEHGNDVRTNIERQWADKLIEIVLPEAPGMSLKDIRQLYSTWSDLDLIQSIPARFGESKQYEAAILDAKNLYSSMLAKDPIFDQILEITKYFAVYICFISLLYYFLWGIHWIYDGYKNNVGA